LNADARLVGEAADIFPSLAVPPRRRVDSRLVREQERADGVEGGAAAVVEDGEVVDTTL
jgi:hypothetical protein